MNDPNASVFLSDLPIFAEFEDVATSDTLSTAARRLGSGGG